jgi:hypothetical protein
MRLKTALKEWSVLQQAMARGQFIAMIRKGGIREQRAGFSLRHQQFLIYPTLFHENSGELARSVQETPGTDPHSPPPGKVVISHYANVRAVWHVTELDKLRKLDGEHGLAWHAVESRFNYRNNPGVHVIALEMMQLPTPVTIVEARRYLGCVSWVELDEPVDVTNATAVLSPEALDARLNHLHGVLGASGAPTATAAPVNQAATSRAQEVPS